MPTIADRFSGSLLGLALADAIGAKYEGGILGALLWKVVGGEANGLLRWTDDTEMAVGLAERLTEDLCLNPDRLARHWADSMQFMRGYQPCARKFLGRIRRGQDWRTARFEVFPQGSFGNGAAMRAAPVGLFYHRRPEDLKKAARLSAEITHAHPIGIEGSVIIARATALALRNDFHARGFLEELRYGCKSDEFISRFDTVLDWQDREFPSQEEVAKRLGNSYFAHESVVTAVYAFCRHSEDFDEMMRFIIGVGGDTDTIGAMAGGIFGAKNGRASLPPEGLARLEGRRGLEDLAAGLLVGRV